MEEVLARHPSVAEVSVVGVRDPYWVEAVVAIVVPRGEVAAEALIAHCREHLASFKVPKAVHLVGELPKSPSGKILKRALRERWEREP